MEIPMEQIKQLRMDFMPLRTPAETGDTIEEQFEEFHRANPHVYENLRKMALSWRRRGRQRAGMKMFFEVLRYQSGIHTNGEPWKLNNNYTALYARKLMQDVPELEGFFEIRERISRRALV